MTSDSAASCGNRDAPAIKRHTDALYAYIETTIHHPFWVVSGHELEQRSCPRELSENEDQNRSLQGRWVNSHELMAGDTLIGQNGEKLVISKISQRFEESTPVSNLTIGEHHNYAVGSNSILVHNESICQAGREWLYSLVKTGSHSIDEVKHFIRTADGYLDDAGRYVDDGFDNADEIIKWLDWQSAYAP